MAGNGGRDPYSSRYIIPNSSPHNPFPHSLRAGVGFEGCLGVWGLGRTGRNLQGSCPRTP